MSLEGRRTGDIVEYEAPGGMLKVEVVAVDA
jgi:transcription elongation GreA/GreB family factor